MIGLDLNSVTKPVPRKPNQTLHCYKIMFKAMQSVLRSALSRLVSVAFRLLPCPFACFPAPVNKERNAISISLCLVCQLLNKLDNLSGTLHAGRASGCCLVLINAVPSTILKLQRRKLRRACKSDRRAAYFRTVKLCMEINICKICTFV